MNRTKNTLSPLLPMLLALGLFMSGQAQIIPYIGPEDPAGDPANRRVSYLDGNRVLMRFMNSTELSGWPDVNAHVWPNTTARLKISDGFGFLVGARVYIENTGLLDTIPVTDPDIITADSSLHVLHYLQTSYREEMDMDLFGIITYGFHPVAGYFNENEEYMAMSNMPSTWPSEGWPSSEGLIGVGQWYGRDGLNTFNADLETYFVANDAQDQEHLGLEDQVRYYPRPGLSIGDLGPNSTQTGAPWGGLGIRVATRGYQWHDAMLRDIIFWEYELANISDYDIPEVILGHWIDGGIGSDGEDDLGYSCDSLDMTYIWDINGVGSGGVATGSMGVAYLGDSTALGIASSCMFPVASHSPSNDTPWFKNDQVMWEMMDTVTYDYMGLVNVISLISTPKIRLPQNTKAKLNLGILHAYEDLEGLNSAEHDAPNLLALKVLAQQVVVNNFHTENLASLKGYSFAPSSYVLKQNYPNPFNPTTIISYDIPEKATVTLTIFDILGYEVMTLQDEVQPPGIYGVQWNGVDHSGKPVNTGVYFCRLQVVDPATGGAGDYSKTIKMVYLR